MMLVALVAWMASLALQQLVFRLALLPLRGELERRVATYDLRRALRLLSVSRAWLEAGLAEGKPVDQARRGEVFFCTLFFAASQRFAAFS